MSVLASSIFLTIHLELASVEAWPTQRPINCYTQFTHFSKLCNLQGALFTCLQQQGYYLLPLYGWPRHCCTSVRPPQIFPSRTLLHELWWRELVSSPCLHYAVFSVHNVLVPCWQLCWYLSIWTNGSCFCVYLSNLNAVRSHWDSAYNACKLHIFNHFQYFSRHWQEIQLYNP